MSEGPVDDLGAQAQFALSSATRIEKLIRLSAPPSIVLDEIKLTRSRLDELERMISRDNVVELPRRDL